MVKLYNFFDFLLDNHSVFYYISMLGVGIATVLLLAFINLDIFYHLSFVTVCSIYILGYSGFFKKIYSKEEYSMTKQNNTFKIMLYIAVIFSIVNVTRHFIFEYKTLICIVNLIMNTFIIALEMTIYTRILKKQKQYISSYSINQLLALSTSVSLLAVFIVYISHNLHTIISKAFMFQYFIMIIIIVAIILRMVELYKNINRYSEYKIVILLGLIIYVMVDLYLIYTLTTLKSLEHIKQIKYFDLILPYSFVIALYGKLNSVKYTKIIKGE